MKREKFSYYEFEIYPDIDCADHWLYRIYESNCKDKVIRESEESFDGELQARLAAIGHISLLENGEG